MNDPTRPGMRALTARLLRNTDCVMLCGPSRVGKSTLCRALASHVLDWDQGEHRRLLMRGAAAVLSDLLRDRARAKDLTVGFENLRRYRRWREFLRDFRARCGPRAQLLVTTDAAPETQHRRARHACLRVHPWSVGECARPASTPALVRPPAPIDEADWAALLEHGGFPEPFIKRDPAFTQQWLAAGAGAGLLQERAALRDPGGLRSLAGMLRSCSAEALVYSGFSRELGVTVETVTRWVELLSRLHYGFCVRPWFMHVAKALRREPKWFLRDWSGVGEPRARQKTFIACHLLKAIESWSDRGLGRFELRYVRDKLGREVDFLVTRDDRPWFLITVGDDHGHAECLERFRNAVRARHAFQLLFDAPFVSTDCFDSRGPSIVSARTLLSQLP